MFENGINHCCESFKEIGSLTHVIIKHVQLQEDDVRRKLAVVIKLLYHYTAYTLLTIDLPKEYTPI